MIRKDIFINILGGKVKNILKKPPMNNTNIPIRKRPLITHLSPFFFMFTKNQKKTKLDNNKYKKFMIIFIRENLLN